MPLSVFHTLALGIPDPANGVVFVHNVGRCGSTLLSKVLQGIPSVHSLSEPDDITQLATLRPLGFSDEIIGPLLKSSVKWRLKPRDGAEPQSVAIKMRSEGMVLADLFGRTFGESKHLFLYRDGVSWLRSVVQNWTIDRDFYDPILNRGMEDNWGNILPIIQTYRQDDAPMNPVQVRILAWITGMEGYLELRRLGANTLAARFEDLTASPTSIIGQLLDFAGIEGIKSEVMQEILGRDSQAGTVFDREERRKFIRELDSAWIQDIEQMIANRPSLKTPDIVLPGTIRPKA
jgi:hypothetical protein